MTAKECPKIRIGKRVKIISSLKKSFIGKDGKIIGRKYDDFFPDTFVYLIAVPGRDSHIWQYGSELEVI